MGSISLLLVCGGAALLALAGLHLTRLKGQEKAAAGIPAQETAYLNNPSASDHPVDGKLLPTPTPGARSDLISIPAAIEQRPIPSRAAGDFERLFTVIAPVHDYFTASEEMSRAEVGERTIPLTIHQLGDRETFNTSDGPRQAELVYQDDLAAYWLETGLSIDRTALVAAAERLHNRYYPLLSQNMGREWRPGVDSDSRITVLQVLGAPDTYELGYFTDENQYPRALFAHSNEREMVYLNMAQLEPGTPLYDGTLVHEVQHLIQWNLDANEDKWLNEGLSQIAESVSGLDTVDPHPYLEQPRIRLDRWVDTAPEVYAHYAGSYLYLLYLWEQAGDAALSELARQPANGLAAVRAVLAGYRPDLTLEGFSADWAAALYLDGESSDPRFSIQRFNLSSPFFADRVRQLPFSSFSTLDQYAVDYIDLDFSGPATLNFAGDTVTALIDSPPGGESFWYAPPVNSGRTQLTAAVDLSGLSGASLVFSTWYDLEPNFDFAYLSASTDGGETWELLMPDHGLVGAYGPAWGGRSSEAADHTDGWVQETIDLNAYAGHPLLLRFDVVTDFEKFGRGFALSGLNVTQLEDQPEWQPNGFVESGYLLPQRWGLRLIQEGETPEVIPLVPDELNRVQAAVNLGPEGGVLVVMPLTPFVESAANYWLSVSK